MARAGFGSYQSYTRQRKRKILLLRILRVLLTFYIAYLLIDGLFFKTFLIQTDSMNPNFQKEDRILTVPLFYEPRLPLIPWPLASFRAPTRGDVVVIQPPYVEDESPLVTFVKDLSRLVTFGYFTPFQDPDPSKHLTIRRLIAVPGDTVSLRGGIAYIKKSGDEFFLSEFEISEKLYDVLKLSLPNGWESRDPFSGEQVEITLKDDEYWVLADNRLGEDSMVWGPVKRKNLKSFVWLTFWPFSRMKLQ